MDVARVRGIAGVPMWLRKHVEPKRHRAEREVRMGLTNECTQHPKTMGKIEGGGGDTVMFTRIGSKDNIPTSGIMGIPTQLRLRNETPKFLDLGFGDGLLSTGLADDRIRKCFAGDKGRFNFKGSGKMFGCDRVPFRLRRGSWVRVDVQVRAG